MVSVGDGADDDESHTESFSRSDAGNEALAAGNSSATHMPGDDPELSENPPLPGSVQQTRPVSTSPVGMARQGSSERNASRGSSPAGGVTTEMSPDDIPSSPSRHALRS